MIGGSVRLNPYVGLYGGPMLELPKLGLNEPQISQSYHIEIWCEKSTMNDVIEPLCRAYGVNFVHGVGEMSTTRCEELVERARKSGRPVRILHVSDFDPAGQSMPFAVARKVEFSARDGTFDDTEVDIQVIPVVLTHEQSIEYRLPRTPLRATDSRAKKFETRFGEGATELDALEALHPGELRRILVSYIERYFDGDLDDGVEAVADEARGDLRQIEREIRDRHANDLESFRHQRQVLGNEAPRKSVTAFVLSARMQIA